MLFAQMQSLETHPYFTLSNSVGIGSYRRTAELRDGVWQGHNLSLHFDDHRSHLTYSEHARPPMVQQRPLQLNSSQVHPPERAQNIPPTPSTSTHQFTCILPIVPPLVLTPRLHPPLLALDARNYQP